MYPLSVNGRSEEGGVFANSVTSKDVQYVQDFFEKEGATRPTFFVIMTEPELYYLLNAKCVVRFPFMSTTGFIEGDEKTFEAEIIARLKDAEVSYIILNGKKEFWEANVAGDVKESKNFRNLMAFVEGNYVEKGEKDGIVIYARKEPK